MSEMLGNQYFMARNYPEAQLQLEEVLEKEPDNKQIQKKLIICYTQNGQIKEALDLFYSLIQEDIEFIINTDPVKDDCPCPELVNRLNQDDNFFETDADKYMVSGILWLYCDIHNSKLFFEKYLDEFPQNKTIVSILRIIKEYINDNNILTPLN